MHEKLREQAEKKVKDKIAVFVCGIVFGCTAIILIMLSIILPAVAIWLLIPIPVMAMVLGIIYVSVFGLPTSGAFSTQWREEEIKKEMTRLHLERMPAPVREDLTEADRLELEELERLKEKWEWREEDLVD
jgi:hypothetical protein